MNQETQLNRRNFIVASLAAGAAVAASPLAMAEKKMDAQSHTNRNDSNYKKVVLTASNCVTKGQVCKAHCLEALQSGNSDLAACLSSVENMLAMCEAAMKIAALGSAKKATVSHIMQACIATCEECIAECEKHASHHRECKDCLESCRECVRACKRLV